MMEYVVWCGVCVLVGSLSVVLFRSIVGSKVGRHCEVRRLRPRWTQLRWAALRRADERRDDERRDDGRRDDGRRDEARRDKAQLEHLGKHVCRLQY